MGSAEDSVQQRAKLLLGSNLKSKSSVRNSSMGLWDDQSSHENEGLPLFSSLLLNGVGCGIRRSLTTDLKPFEHVCCPPLGCSLAEPVDGIPSNPFLWIAGVYAGTSKMNERDEMLNLKCVYESLISHSKGADTNDKNNAERTQKVLYPQTIDPSTRHIEYHVERLFVRARVTA
ncbi:hypothetical protein LA080_011682 [Diaporthe eres]|nr:hypothetical protein LA080_011682 [Diaporthe eres]